MSIKQIHDQEQTDAWDREMALKMEFDRLWHGEILPKALHGCQSHTSLMAIRHLCFHTFLVAKGLK